MNIKHEGHSLTLVQGHSDSAFSNFFSLETARSVEAKFHLEPQSIVVYDMKLVTDDRSDKKFLLTSKLCPLGDVCLLCRGYIHVQATPAMSTSRISILSLMSK